MKYCIPLLIALGSCLPKVEKTEGGQEMAAVKEMLQQYYRDMSARDWEKYRTHFWPDATISTAWQAPGDSSAKVDVTTIDDFIKGTPNGPDSQPVFEEKMGESAITIRNNLATAWVDYSAKFGTPENLSEWKGTDVFTLLRHDGQWRIVSLTFESDH